MALAPSAFRWYRAVYFGMTAQTWQAYHAVLKTLIPRLNGIVWHRSTGATLARVVGHRGDSQERLLGDDLAAVSCQWTQMVIARTLATLAPELSPVTGGRVRETDLCEGLR